MAEMETREFEVRADLEERTITGIAVPYGQDANIGGAYMERFVPGAISDVTDVKLFYGHEEPIGKVLTGRDTEAGYEITAKVSDTARGNEVMTLMRDGVLNKFSVGFVPLESERDGQTVTRTKVSLKEVSVVPFPAFAGANITEVREDGGTPAETSEPQPEQENPMSENIELDVRAVQDEVAEIRRLVEAGQTVATPAPMGSEFRSQGEFAKALVAGDNKAQEFARAASTSADAAIVAPWFGYINTLIANNRPTVSVFSRAALPATGLTVEYSKIDSNTLAVTQQVDGLPPVPTENAELAFGNLTFETVSTPVKTYGGYTSFSRQYVERSQVNTLDQVFQGLALAYAGATNAALVAAIGALDYTGKVFDADGGTASSLAEGIANGAGYIFTNTGLRPEFILTGVDGYVKLAKVAAGDGRPVLLADGAGVNNIGTMNVTGLAGSVFGLPIVVDPAIGTGIVYMANSQAVITMESAGAPVRLTDGDITTLTDSVSVYGYMAIATPREGAIVKLDVTA
jgi:HK97 family phage prohead protease/HK97 family phage major capsid protein